MTTAQLPLYSLIVGALGLLATWLTYSGIKKQPAGNEVMRDLAAQIHAGALTFLRREYTVLLPFLVIVASLLGIAISVKTGIAYVAGGMCSIITGWVGMQGATRANERTALDALLDPMAEAVECWLDDGIERAMNRFNR